MSQKNHDLTWFPCSPLGFFDVPVDPSGLGSMILIQIILPKEHTCSVQCTHLSCHANVGINVGVKYLVA